jgi:membrane associated rhomboid family serine protease
MIIPIGLEEDSVRRVPWVVIGIIALCFLALLATNYLTDASPDKAGKLLEEYTEYFVHHPYLELHPEMEALLSQAAGEENLGAVLEEIRAFGLDIPMNEERLAEQAELDAIAEELLQTIESMPNRRWGLIPGKMSLLTLITHIFMHGGWLHLIANLFILYLCGPFVEDVWGRWFFGAFFLIAGVAAGLGHALHYPESTIPLVGASGAIAGVMGAFLIRYWRMKIRFFYIFSLLIRGTFWAPAWLMLPLWLLGELFSATLIDYSGLGGMGGIAYWAHVWGFIIGAVIALGMKQLRIEERFLSPAIESSLEAEVVSNPAIDQAMEANTAGATDRAYRILAEEHRRHPANIDVGLALWRIAEKANRSEQAVPAMLRVIQEEIRSRQADLAVDHWRELVEHQPHLAFDPPSLVRIGRGFAEGGFPEDAQDAFGRLLQQADASLTAVTLLLLARHTKDSDPAMAREAIERVLGRPDLHPEERSQAEQLLNGLASEDGRRRAGGAI